MVVYELFVDKIRLCEKKKIKKSLVLEYCILYRLHIHHANDRFAFNHTKL